MTVVLFSLNQLGPEGEERLNLNQRMLVLGLKELPQRGED